MAKYRCPMCGWVYDEQAEGAPFSELERCPMCGAPAAEFYPVEDDGVTPAPVDPAPAPVSASVPKEAGGSLAIPAELRRVDPAIRHMDTIHALAEHGRIPDGAMATTLPLPRWEDILVLGAQLSPMPLADGAPVDIEEGRERGAARQHLYAERAGTGERIEDTRPLDAVVERRLGHGDARLAHAIGRRARHIAPLGL